jgi:pimeloyl-ACP methyl ester carboxylesterase
VAGGYHPFLRRISKVILLLAAIGAGLYLLLLILLFSLQTKLLFPGSGRSPLLPHDAERLSIMIGEGQRLVGIHVPPDPDMPNEKSLILGFGGNGWNADAAALTLHNLYPGSDIVTFHFRGYPPSSGSPSASALLADAPRELDYVVRHFPGRRVIAVGMSVGTAAAARLATDGRVSGAILITPFDSLRRVAQAHFRWAPVSLLFRHRLEPVEDVRRAKVPIAIVAAAEDEMVPRWSTDALARATAHLVFERVVPQCDHNTVYWHPAFRSVMRAALNAVSAPSLAH